MNVFVKKDEKSELRKKYDEAVELLGTFVSGSKEYLDQLDVVERIHKMLMEEECHKKTVSPDSIVAGAIGLLQVGAIIGHERFHNITTKAMNFVFKGRAR